MKIKECIGDDTSVCEGIEGTSFYSKEYNVFINMLLLLLTTTR